ncbi:MAG: hypothetical protein JNL18_01710 [Planctomycetaceae bacterium]|nr:hypothetical protein [Planctomycetaceae bacterium]
MLISLRYALAPFCFAASVGCLALWGRSMSNRDFLTGPELGGRIHCLDCVNGRVIYRPPDKYSQPRKMWRSNPVSDTSGRDQYGSELFGPTHEEFGVYCPLWYPALIFALAGVGILRVGRFTIRSALIAMTIVAALLGMVVVL